ncbi:Neuronal acetylcholine receptor subunit alpha-10 [Aphelenchoides besseyi]|nr:Neuronal acetylcholine receptor subunit alpha-10 [Aphelenchoides besseyi]
MSLNIHNSNTKIRTTEGNTVDKNSLYEADTPKQAEARLLQHLLKVKANNYDRNVRPVLNASSTVTVKLGMTLTNIFDIDEKSQVLQLQVWLDQEWQDQLLVWDPADFDNITNLRIPCDLLWTPDLVNYNNADDFSTTYMRARAMVFHTGTVFWPPPVRLRSLCRISVTYFPFDDQLCSLKFGSWSYHGFQLDITNRSLNIDLSNYVESGEFELIRVHQKRSVVKYSCCPEEYPDIRFYLHVRRKILYYLHNVIFPCSLLSVLTLFGFFLPPDSNEKVGLFITILLSFSVFVLAIAEKMPETSDSLPLIGLYLTSIMVITTCSICTTVLVLNFHHRGPLNEPPSPFLHDLVLTRLRKFLRVRLPEINLVRTAPPTPVNYGNKLRRATLIECNGSLLENENDQNSNHNDQRRKSSQVILQSIQELLRQQSEDSRQQYAAEQWRQVAEVIDRLLFYIFLLLTVLVTGIMLIVVPVWRRLFFNDQFDEQLFGID